MKSSINTSNGYNHFNSNYLAFVEHKTDSSQAHSHGLQSQSNCRTPIAWHNRSINLSKPLSLVQTPVNYPTKYRRPSGGQRTSQRPSSPSATTTSSDDREEVPMVRHHMRRPNRYVLYKTSKLINVLHLQKLKTNEKLLMCFTRKRVDQSSDEQQCPNCG